MAAGVAFLQADVDEANPRSFGAYKPGNTDVIRQMLRDQQRNMGSLHANALFREFRGDGQQRKFGKGYACPQDVPELSMVNDFQAEGQTRMFDLIKNTALRDEKPLRGVWASFGKPYICMGDPQDPQSKLPTLYRDELAGIEKSKKEQKGGRQRKPAAAAAPAPAPAAAAPGTDPAGQPPGTAGSNRANSGRRIGTAASMASLEGTMRPEEVLEHKLNKIKTVMRFGNNDHAEVTFPSGPLKQAGMRRMRSQARPGSFVDPEAASQEVTDPFLAYGQPHIPQRVLKPTHKPVPKGTSDHHSSVFITQGEGGQAVVEEESSVPMRRSMMGHEGTRSMMARRSSIGFTDKPLGMSEQFDAGQGPLDDADSDGGQETNNHQGGPSFRPLVTEAVPMRGDEDNPVYSWHNNFLRVRQQGRAALQAALYERAEGRFRARTVGPMAANLSSILMADLDLVRGKQVPYATLGALPASPYVKMDSSWTALQQRAANAARAAQQLDPEELRVLQRFYDQLCALVEAQRMSDPLSLMVIHKVKSLLEEGTFLQRVMFENVLAHMGRFVSSTGVRKYNRYLLSIFTFIAKCTGVNEADFESLINEAGLCLVVYNSALPPSQTAAAAQGANGEHGLLRVRTSKRSAGGKSQSSPKKGAGATGARAQPLESPTLAPLHEADLHAINQGDEPVFIAHDLEHRIEDAS